MTIFGTDISGHQGRIDIKRLKANAFQYIMIKCTQGRSFESDDYDWQIVQAKEAGMLVAVYHFLEHHSRASIAQQVANLYDSIGDRRIPVAVDSETWEGLRPTDQDIKDFVTGCRQRGLRVTLTYAQGIDFLPSGTVKWHASYESNRNGYASVVYQNMGGDNSDKWKTSIPTTIWQFGSNIEPWAGYSGTIDGNAFRGTLDQLKALNIFFDPNNPDGEDDMALSAEDKVWIEGAIERRVKKVLTDKWIDMTSVADKYNYTKDEDGKALLAPYQCFSESSWQVRATRQELEAVGDAMLASVDAVDAAVADTVKQTLAERIELNVEVSEAPLPEQEESTT